MKYLLKKISINLLTIFLISQLIPSFGVSGGLNGLLISSVFLYVFMGILRPILNLVMLPLNLATLNLSSWILNIILIYFWSIITPPISIQAQKFPGGVFGPFSLNPMDLLSWQVFLISAILLVLTVKFFNWIFS